MTRSRFGSSLAFFFLVMTAFASAAEAQSSLGRQLAEPLPEAPAPSETPPPTPSEAAASTERPWVGPQIELTYGYLKLSDGHGGGDSHFAQFEIFIQLPVSEIRLGAAASLGARDYTLGGDDLLARGSVELGFQLTELLDPLVPYLSVVGSAGALVGQRFESTVAYAVGGAGVELGAALRAYRNFHFAFALSYQRWEMDGAGFDVFQVRLGLGL